MLLRHCLCSLTAQTFSNVRSLRPHGPPSDIARSAAANPSYVAIEGLRILVSDSAADGGDGHWGATEQLGSCMHAKHSDIPADRQPHLGLESG